MNQVSVFQRFTKVVDQQSIEQIIKSIRDGSYEDPITTIRAAIKKGNEERANKLKKQLLAFTPSGQFEGGRTLIKLKQYVPLIVLDLDKLPPHSMFTIRGVIEQHSYTHACFVSPSGRGFKILVRTDTTQENHKEAFEQVANHYAKFLGVPIDPSGKDITRLCFFSHDENAYYHPTSQIMKINPAFGNVAKSPETTFHNCIQLTEQKLNYLPGSRNNFIYLLASNCNRAGLNQQFVLQFITQRYDLPETEIQAAINSAYTHHQYEFSKWTKESSTSNEAFKSPPCLPDKIFDQLPHFLKNCCAQFPNKRERDVFLTGALTVISGCLPTVSGYYDRRHYHANLYSFVIAPAASGKGSLIYAKAIGMRYHKAMIEKSRAAKKQYSEALSHYEKQLAQYRKGKLAELPKEPDQPDFKVLYIPANSSSAMIIRHLNQAAGSNVMFESESDTLGNILKQEWSSYSDMLRKAFHHESITYSRKANAEFLEIEQPCLSVALSGTPSQIGNLITSVEDGLLSRFLFYVFKVKVSWRDVSPNSNLSNLTHYFEEQSKALKNIIDYLQTSSTRVVLTTDQWRRFNKQFTTYTKAAEREYINNATSIIKRLGLITFRFCMIFTALRKYEEQVTAQQLTCTDTDFETALALIDVYHKHAFYLMERLPHAKVDLFDTLPRSKQKYYEALPDTFKRKEAVEIGKTFDFSRAKVDRILAELNGQLLQQPNYGLYEKISS